MTETIEFAQPTGFSIEGIAPPPPLRLPSISAPQSRVTTPPPPPRKRRSFSQPTSPIAKKPLSPIAKQQLSPTRAIRKRHPRVAFSTYKPPTLREAPCPVHSYSTIEQELHVKPSRCMRGQHGVKWSDEPREVLAPTRTNCPVHVYSAALSTLSQLGSASFAKHEAPAETTAACPVHAYATPPSSMRTRPATFAKHATPRGAPAREGPLVHAYAEMSSTLSARGATAFSMEGGRDTFQRTARALAPVTAYAPPSSTLRTGGATFGSAPRDALPSLSRTGLLVAPPAGDGPAKRATRAQWRTLKALPKLVALAEAAAQSGGKEGGEGGESPREVMEPALDAAAAA